MAKSITNGNWSRIGDNALGFGMVRYSNGGAGSERILWRMEITGNPGTKLTEVDAKISDLRAISTWCERAIETLQTDGGRMGDDEHEAEKAA